MQNDKGRAASVARGIARDLSAMVGVGLVSYGAWLIYQPAGFITLGSLLLAACIIGVPAKASA